jgi:hypothetical protein
MDNRDFPQSRPRRSPTTPLRRNSHLLNSHRYQLYFQLISLYCNNFQDSSYAGELMRRCQPPKATSFAEKRCQGNVECLRDIEQALIEDRPFASFNIDQHIPTDARTFCQFDLSQAALNPESTDTLANDCAVFRPPSSTSRFRLTRPGWHWNNILQPDGRTVAKQIEPAAAKLSRTGGRPSELGDS